MTPLRERLLSKAVINWETGCWEWTGHLNHGYGRIALGGYHSPMVRVHRASYELVYGPIPHGLVIDHLCEVRHCINPAHLEAVTVRENTLRGTGPAAANAAKTHCSNGHEFTPENTCNKARGGRSCRTCRTQQEAAYAART